MTVPAPMVRVALAGFGNVGRYLAGKLDGGTLKRATPTAVTARDLDKARAHAVTLKRPSEANPKTSRIVAPSVLAALRSTVATLHVGS
ncbi:MAG: hypothetical protein FJX57_08500 [Alphaproteobacteria bacterium]|nr:hypothetical protein [Alphaproteobacteria bacterium]